MLSLLQFTCLFLRKVPFKLSSTRKARIRKRLKRVEQNLQVLNSVGIQCHALEEANKLPTYSTMNAFQRYWYVKRSRTECTKLPVHWYPKYTKVQLPLDPVGSEMPKFFTMKPAERYKDALALKQERGWRVKKADRK